MMAKSEIDGAHIIINMDDSIPSTTGESNYHSFQDDFFGKDNIGMPLICKIESTYISDEDKRDYEPNILSIGPYHNGKPTSKATQTIKYEYLNYFLKMNPNKNLKDYLKAIKGMENEIRSYYRDEIEMDNNAFLTMLLLDGCFILLTLNGAKEISPPIPNIPRDVIKMKECENIGEIILDMEALEAHVNHQNIQTKGEDAINEDDHYQYRMGDFGSCSRDILLLENQIPFFVITKIYEIAYGENNKTSLLIERIVKSIEGIIGCYSISLNKFNRPKEFHHLLHLCHMYFKPGKISLDHNPCQWHRATEYSKAGINFKKREFSSDNPHSLFDISFCDGTMEIPSLTIDDDMRCLFRNLIAFEQTYPHIEKYVTAYAIFWSRFMSMPEDASLLTKKGILVHQLNSDAEVSDIFKKLIQGIVTDLDGDSYLNSTCYMMEVHYQMNKPRLMTWLGEVVSKFSGTLSTFSS